MKYTSVIIAVIVGVIMGGLVWVLNSLTCLAVMPAITFVRHISPLLALPSFWLVAFVSGIVSGGLVHVFARLPKRVVLIAVLCSYVIIDNSIRIFLLRSAPEGSFFYSGSIVAVMDAVSFTIGAVAGYFIIRKPARQRAESTSFAG